MPVGVLSVQGDFAKHLEALDAIGVEGLGVRTPEDLAQVDRLILPGGESTTVGLLLERFGLGEAIKARIAGGMPAWGTCMGLILLAREVAGRAQYSLGALDVGVERNAFGSQVHSFEDSVRFEALDAEVEGVFIRAPVVSRVGPGVEVLSEYGGRVVAVRQGKVVGTSFHPELTRDRRIHEWFVGL